MTAHTGQASSDEIAEDDDPRLQQVYKRFRTLALIAGATMGVGFLAVFSVIAYRVVKAPPSGGFFERTLALPAGARILSAAADGGRVIVTVEAEGRTTLHLFDAGTLAPTGRLDLGPAAPAAR